MHLLPDQIPDLFHFFIEYHERVAALLMRFVAVQSYDPILDGSSEPCWKWLGDLRPLDREPLDPGFEPTDPELVPHIHLGQLLNEEEQARWTPGQLQHLLVPARMVAYTLRETSAWRSNLEYVHHHFTSPCAHLDCVQPWHIMAITFEDLLKVEDQVNERLAIIDRFQRMKQRYQASIMGARKHAAPSPHRSGPQLVQDSIEYTRRENWLALYDTKLQRALQRHERRWDRDYTAPACPVRIAHLNTEHAGRLERFMAANLDRSGECWVIRPESKYYPTGKISFQHNGRTYSLKRLLFALHSKQEIPAKSMVRNNCHNFRCQRPLHHDLVLEDQVNPRQIL